MTNDASLLHAPVRNPGRLVLGPTLTSGADPLYGGTSLGFGRGYKVEWVVRYQEIHDPASGNLLKVIRRTVEYPRVVVLIDPPWNDTILGKLFTQTASKPGETALQGATVQLAVMAPINAPVAFIANDPALKSFHFRMAVPMLTLSEATDLSVADVAGLPVVLEPLLTVDTGDAGYPYIGTKPPWQVCQWANMVL